MSFVRILKALQGYRRPLAWVDLGAFEQNSRALLERARGLPIRLATKSIRCPELILRTLATPGYRGILTYRGWESVELAHLGIRDQIIGYPTTQPEEIRAVLAENEKGAEIRFVVDSGEHLRILQEQSQGRPIPVVLDIDLSGRWGLIHFGVRRSPLASPEAIDLWLQGLKECPSIRLVGVMGYEAQIAGVPDASPLLRLLKRISAPQVQRLRVKLVEQLRRRGHAISLVNGGGTGSFETTREDPSVTELSAGSGLFAPGLFDEYLAFRHAPAAGFALEVVRRPAQGIVTCMGGGYVASGSTGSSRLPIPVHPAGLTLLPHEGAGEVQTPLEGDPADLLQLGDSVLFRHAKAGELCERFDELHLIRGDSVVEIVPTYRGRGWNFG